MCREASLSKKCRGKADELVNRVAALCRQARCLDPQRHSRSLIVSGKGRSPGPPACMPRPRILEQFHRGSVLKVPGVDD